MDEPERDRLIAHVAAQAAELLANTRIERARRVAAGEDTSWLDQLLRELEPITKEIHDADVFQAIRRVVEQHGAGPYPADELAIIAGMSTEDVLRVSQQMVAEGLASPADEPPRS
ncbi:hypothetical protein [Amycolatopsis sp. NPDC059657]|uniref:hypothetical protein n=1 Tax=Amycolatopsis sp. NPDC059657 TaxID=3346899 RepID=UPI00366BB061